MQPLSRWLSWLKTRRRAGSLCLASLWGVRGCLLFSLFSSFLAIEDADVDANADAGGALEKGLGAGAQGCGVVGG